MSESKGLIDIILENALWPYPLSKNFGELKDPALFLEALKMAYKEHVITREKLNSSTDGIRQRLRNLWVVDKPTDTTIAGLLSAMKNFGWIKEFSQGTYLITAKGEQVYNLSKDNRSFRRTLLEEMHKRYVIPGWIISKLYKLNPKGQGEIVLPSAPKDWQPDREKWENSTWCDEFSEQVLKSTNMARKYFPGSFPIDDLVWIQNIKKKWQRKGSGIKRKVSKIKKNDNGKEKPKISFFGPRERLNRVMRDAAVELLFSPDFVLDSLPEGIVLTDLESFTHRKYRMPGRAIGAWCPRLEALELLFYTDSHPMISGRLIFPCSAFKKKANCPPFEKISGITDPSGDYLFLYQPKWHDIKSDFMETLISSYMSISKKIGALYISLLDVRDEVCRQLRISALLFDEFLKITYLESIKDNIKIPSRVSISLESDIRPEQKSGFGLLRRPVYIDNVPHSLIAIAIG
jgi:hypothetical protein